MDDNPEISDRLNVNKSTYHNKRPRESSICFIRGAKWMKINQLNGPSLIYDTSTWLNQSIQTIRHVCCWLGIQKILPWKCFRTAFGHYDLLSTSKLDTCANVTTCCWDLSGYSERTMSKRPSCQKWAFRANFLWDRSPVMLRKLHTNPSKFFGVDQLRGIVLQRLLWKKIWFVN